MKILTIFLGVMVLLSYSVIAYPIACNADFDQDGDVDTSDQALILSDYGRNLFNNPCTNDNQCYGDFNCDHDVDGSDLITFLGYKNQNPTCPICWIPPCPPLFQCYY